MPSARTSDKLAGKDNKNRPCGDVPRQGLFRSLCRSARSAHQRCLPCCVLEYSFNPFPAKALITTLGRFRNAEMVLMVPGKAQEHGILSFIDPYLEWWLGAYRR